MESKYQENLKQRVNFLLSTLTEILDLETKATKVIGPTLSEDNFRSGIALFAVDPYFCSNNPTASIAAETSAPTTGSPMTNTTPSAIPIVDQTKSTFTKSFGRL